MQNSTLPPTYYKYDANTASRTTVPREPRDSLTLSDVLERSNMLLAMKRVRANKGTAGSDNLSIDETTKLLQTEWPSIKDKLLAGQYKPTSVKMVEVKALEC